ncbi:thiamine phosphate synthase [Nocardioides korecus]
MTGRTPAATASLLDLYLVTDTASCGERGVAETVRLAARGGVTLVQVREPGLGTRDLCALTRAVQDALAGTGVPVVVNDRVDVALAVGADGVHVGQGDLPPDVARQLLGPRALVGLSVSTADQVAEAQAWNARGPVLDYLGVGPVWATPTKPEAATPLGLERTAALVALAASTDLPCVAIGGIGPDVAASVRATGVAGLAVVSAVCAAADPAAAASALRAGVAR